MSLTAIWKPSSGSPRPRTLWGPIVQRLEDEMARVLGREWFDTWREGLPDWEDTPGEINIHVILRLRNLALAFDMIEYAKMRYNLFGSGGHWFPGKRADGVEELDLSACLKNSPHADKIPGYLAEIHQLLAGEQRHRLQQE